MKLKLAFLAVLMLVTWPFLNSDSIDRERREIEDVASRDAFRHLQLSDEHGQILPGAVAEAYQQIDAMPILPGAWNEWTSTNLRMTPSNVVPRPPWVWIGPDEGIAGRIRSILINPNDPLVMWVAGVTGGIWKTTDGGTTWRPVNDYMANLNVSCMALDPSNSNVLYAGTGGETESGHGIFKSYNGGEHWTALGSTYGNTNFWSVYRIAVNPKDSTVLLAATYPNGLFRSTNSGMNWSQVGQVDEMFDVHFSSTNKMKCIASDRRGRAFYSEDMGATWQLATWSIPAQKDRPLGSVKLAYAPSDPSIVYAISENSTRIYRSSDGGKIFQARGSCCTSSLWWALVLWVDPTDPNVIVFGGSSLFRSEDGGMTGANSVFVNTPHMDHQLLVEDPRYGINGNRTVYCGTDNGIYRTENIRNVPDSPPQLGNSWVNWQSLNKGLGVTQFLGADGNSEGKIIGGTQDNGTVTFLPPEWRTVYGGDGGYCAADQTDTRYFYGSSPFGGILRSSDGGQSTQYIGGKIPRGCAQHPCANWTAPFTLDPNNPSTLLVGGTDLWKSTNAREVVASQVTWVSVKPPMPSGSFISAVAVTPGDSKFIWVAHNDGSLFFTRNGTETAPTWIPVQGLPHRWISRITIVSPTQIYITLGGYSNHNVWRNVDGTGVFEDISGNLPHIPIYCLVASPFQPGHLYVATQMGVFASADGGVTWSATNNGPANVVVFQLFWIGRKLFAATFGRGMFVLGSEL